jgi:hypothetical protein
MKNKFKISLRNIFSLIFVMIPLISLSNATGLFADSIYRISSENTSDIKSSNLYAKNIQYSNMSTKAFHSVPTVNSLLTEDDNSINVTKVQSNITYDPGFGCSNKYWGTKNYQNGNELNPAFGRNNDCNDNPNEPSLPDESGIKNYIKVMAETGETTQESIAWQAAIQGTDPWGYDSKNNGGALNHNDRFQLSPDLDYDLKVQYLWFDDSTSRPQNANDNLKASLLVDLWFADTASPRTTDGLYKNVLVIDLAFANLENDGGKWRQDTYLWEGVQYFRPYAEKNNDNGQTIYYYNIVLDTDGKNPMVWYAPSSQYNKSIKEIINDAFSYSYKSLNNEKIDTPIKSNYKLVDVEMGAEVWNDVGARGTIVAAFSECKLTYK